MTEKQIELCTPILKSTQKDGKPFYKQSEIEFDDFKIILTTSIIERSLSQTPDSGQNKKAIFFFTGIHKYYFYHYIRILYLDYDFYIVDIPSFGFNNNYEYKNIKIPNSYFDDENLLNTYLYKTFNFLSENYSLNKYDEIDLLGFSTGGLIILNFMLEYEKNPIKSLTFNKIMLNSPLTRIYAGSSYLTYFFKYLSYFVGIFSNKIDISPYTGTKSNEIVIFNKCLDDIYLNLNIDENYYIDLNYTSDIAQPKYPEWINCCGRIYNKLIKNKINTKVNCVSSNQYTSNPTYYNGDCYTNPEYIFTDLALICNNYKLKQYNTGHDTFLEPFNDDHKVSYIEIFNFLENDN